MARLTEEDCRQRWDKALRERGWVESKLRLAMFDHRPAEHGPTRYHPVPAWPTIADDDNTADESDYIRIERSLLAQGEEYSRRRAAAHTGHVVVELVARPISVSRERIVATIKTVMANVHPRAVTQEQILHAAFFAQLREEFGMTIGTTRAAVHPARPTPSSDYVITGKRGAGMRAPVTTWASGTRPNRRELLGSSN
jgi:hypothetical protein